jgi:DNA-binding IclR family transcriptional regulator
VHLAVLEGSDVVFIAIVRGEPTAKPLARVGGRLPAHATALGKAMLAFSPQDIVERVAYGGLIRRTPRTISEPTALLQELADVQRSGIAVEREECASDRSCIASPILGLGGAPIAAISVAGSVQAMMPERIAAAVRAAGMTLSRRIGGGRTH